MAFTPVSVIGPASTQISVGQFQQNHPNILKNWQTRERDRHDADYTSLGGCDCASLLAGIPQSIPFVRKSRGSENTCPYLFDSSIAHTVPSGLHRHFVYGRILLLLARSLSTSLSISIDNPNDLELLDHRQTMFYEIVQSPPPHHLPTSPSFS